MLLVQASCSLYYNQTDKLIIDNGVTLSQITQVDNLYVRSFVIESRNHALQL